MISEEKLIAGLIGYYFTGKQRPFLIFKSILAISGKNYRFLSQKHRKFSKIVQKLENTSLKISRWS